MGWRTRWFNRPFLWLLLALPLALGGMVFAGETVQALGRPTERAGVLQCDRDFDDGCLTTRSAVLESTSDRRGERFNGTRTWQLNVKGDWPRRPHEPRLTLEFRWQAGSDELRAGTPVDVVFAGSEAIWVRVPSGAVLETTAHPWQAVPADGFGALALLGGAVWAVDTAVRGARSRRSWFRAGLTELEPGIASAVFMVGFFGLMVQFNYPRPTMLGVAGLVLTVWLGWVVLRRRFWPDRAGLTSLAAQSVHRRRWAGLLGELERLSEKGVLGDGDRRNGHLALIIRPSKPRRWALAPDRVAAAAERALATRGWADFAPDLTSDGWARFDDGVRLVRGVGADGRVDEDRLLEVTARDDGVIQVLCGRGTSHISEPWPRSEGGDPVQDVPVVLPALLLGLTRAALLLAAELTDDPADVWSVGVGVDRLRGAVARELLLIDAAPVPLDRDHYARALKTNAPTVLKNSARVSRQIIGPLLRDLGVADVV